MSHVYSSQPSKMLFIIKPGSYYIDVHIYVMGKMKTSNTNWLSPIGGVSSGMNVGVSFFLIVFL